MNQGYGHMFQQLNQGTTPGHAQILTRMNQIGIHVNNTGSNFAGQAQHYNQQFVQIEQRADNDSATFSELQTFPGPQMRPLV